MLSKTISLLSFAVAVNAAGVFVLSAAPPSRIAASRVDNSRRVFLNGHVHPNARPQFDQGLVSPQLQLTHVTLNLKPSATQQAELDKLLADQQDPSSANYHHWLTPEDFAARFGVSDPDVSKITDWLTSQGLTVTGTARAKNWVAFDGDATHVQQAFQTELHQYLVDGEVHYANATAPSIPAALQPVVRSVHGLNDFRMKPRSRAIGPVPVPRYTGQVTGNHYIAPDDLAVIYNIRPLLNSGIDGTGQKIAIIGQTAINLSDLQQFRASYNLPGQDPTVMLVPGSRDPGVRKSDLSEADLDIEWTSSIARNATIVYVYAPSVDTSLQYAIDQNLAPVLSISYGSCEPDSGSAWASQLQAMAQQANSQGMTWFSASGDSGGADCASGTASNGVLSVDLPAAVPEVTGVGGTEFAEGAGVYWNSANDPNQASALSYIPEVVWNDSVADGSPSASGGGASTFFGKPLWQTGPGVPADGARDVPDVSLSASADHDGYLVYTGGSLQAFGGTSVAAPSFAGIAALLNQYLVANKAQAAPGLGNINPKLYSLAQTSPTAFHDIISGDNLVTVTCRRGCTSNAPVGYAATANYDRATGLGSVDVFNLISAWTSGTAGSGAPKLVLAASNLSLASGDSTTLTATVTSSTASTPSGSVTFLAGSKSLGTAQLSGSNGISTASLTVLASQLPSGTNTITAQYNSDTASFSNALASLTVTVAPAAGSVSISGIADGASFRHAYAPGSVLSVFGTDLASSIQTAAAVPLPLSMAGVSATVNGIAAPVYLVSPTQLNIQIPYETPAGSTASLVISNSGQTASYSFEVAATAPAIFTDANGAPVPGISGRAGDVLTLFVTGAGAMTPAVSTGSAPPSGTAVTDLPRPVQQPVSVTVGGLTAPVQFAGIPSGLVGVMQINYQVPAGLTAGIQPVVVTIGGASSTEANLAVSQ